VQGKTALYCATHLNKLDVAEVLLEKGADVEAKGALHSEPPVLSRGGSHHLVCLYRILTVEDAANHIANHRTSLPPSVSREGIGSGGFSVSQYRMHPD
jgi:ankyrin repeat protein